MKITRRRFLVFASVLFTFLGATTNLAARNTWPQYSGTPAGPAAFIRTAGNRLVLPDGSPFLIKGIAFGNNIWNNPAHPDQITHHGPEDFFTVKKLGFNTIRFYLNYRLFEDDESPYRYKESGFTWLENNIAAARSAGLYLILNMHLPQGGYQSTGTGDALWTDPENQKRLVSLWTEIARRYKDEETILGYGLVNEPVPVDGVAQWTTLAQNIINGIRSVDTYHLLFVERACWLKNEPTEAERASLFFPQGLVDPGPHQNIVLEFHMYEPMDFTHQNAHWIESLGATAASYPDETRILADGRKWAGFSDTGPALAAGTSRWRNLPGRPYRVTNPEFRIARPVIQAQGLGPDGIVYADSIEIKEYSPAGRLLRTMNFTPGAEGEIWYFWSQNGSGSATAVPRISGARSAQTIQITGTTGDANYGLSSRQFIVHQNHSYTISGRIRGENIPADALVRFRIDFDSADALYSWNKNYLESVIELYSGYSRTHSVPLYLGEFGSIIYSFEQNRGGERWVADMLEILTAREINYTYHTYHETNFGLYTNTDSQLPDPTAINEKLRSVFLRWQ